MIIALVFPVITFSKSEIGGRAKPVSIREVIGTTLTPAAQAKPL
jgi:hypothetical protein